MIKVTDVAGNVKIINCDLIERVEANPDTVIFLVNGHNIILRDSPDEVVEKVVQFRRRCTFPADSASEGNPPEISAP